MTTRIFGIALFIIASGFSGCNIGKTAEKFRPEAAEQFDDQVITALLERDNQFFMDQFAHTYDDPSIPEKAIANLFSFVPEGEESSRLLVGAGTNTSVNLNTEDGRTSTRTWNTTYELKVGDKYLSVDNHYTTNDAGECCVLTNVNVNSYDTPQLAMQLEQMQKGANIVIGVLIAILVLIIGLIVFFVKRSKRKKAAQTSQ